MVEPGRIPGFARLAARLKALRGGPSALIAALLLLIFLGESLVMVTLSPVRLAVLDSCSSRSVRSLTMMIL